MYPRSNKFNRLVTELKALAEAAKATYGADEPAAVLPGNDEPIGYSPGILEGKHSVTLWNLRAYVGQRIVASQADMIVSLQLLENEPKYFFRCTVTDNGGSPKQGVPVDLGQWQLGRPDLLFVEKKTNDQGQVEFELWDEDLPWTSVAIGTIDGVTSIADLQVPGSDTTSIAARAFGGLVLAASEDETTEVRQDNASLIVVGRIEMEGNSYSVLTDQERKIFLQPSPLPEKTMLFLDETSYELQGDEENERVCHVANLGLATIRTFLRAPDQHRIRLG